MTTSAPTGFTDDEVSGVVNQLVQTTVRRPIDTLGVRRTDVSFTDLQTASANVLILYSAAPFYVVKLASARLLELCQSCETDLLALLTSLHVLRKRTTPVRDISALVNAKVALGALGTAVAGRTKNTNVTVIPAYNRFNTNVTRFLSQVGGNVKDPVMGVVPTPQEARGSIPQQLSTVQADLTELVRRAGLIGNALADFGSLNLPDLVLSSVISNSETLLSSRIATLTAMDETTRLTVLRQTILEVLSTQSVVTGFGVFGAPDGVISLTGVGTAFADANRPADGAQLMSDKPGPYALYAGDNESDSSNILYIYADTSVVYPGTPTYKLYIPASIYAKVEGLNPGPYAITGGTNDSFQLLINGVTTVTIALPTGAAVSALTVEAAMTAALTTFGFKAEGFFSPLMFDGQVNTNAGNVLTLPIGYFPPSSVNPGDQVDFYFGTNAPTTRNVTAVTTSVGNILSITVDGAALIIATDDRIQYGSSARRIRILPIDIPASLAAGDFIQVLQPTAVETNAGITLGFYGTIAGKTMLTNAQTIVNYINGNVPVVNASVTFNSAIGSLFARTEASNVLTFVVYLQADTSATWTGGTTIDITLSSPITDSRIVAGSNIILRGGSNPDAVGAIDSISSDGLTITADFTVTIMAVMVPSAIEIMPPFPFVQKGMVLTIPTGVNAGLYYVDVPDPNISGQFKATMPAPLPRDQFNQNILIPASDIGTQGFSIDSKSKLLTSSISVFDQQLTFWNTQTPLVTTTTSYFQLPSLPQSLAEGDFLDEFITSVDTPDATATIVSVDGDGVIQLDMPVAFNLSLTFGVVTAPYGVLRQAIVNNYTQYKGLIQGWAANFPLATSTYFDNLNALINPLLKNTNPTDADIGAAEAAINFIYSLMTIAGATNNKANPNSSLESIINSYTATVVPQIDTLVTTYTQKGADRAMDLFLEPQFSTFFGLTQQQSSYAGNFQAAAQAVAVNDLVITKTNRTIANKSQLTGTSQSPDYESDSSDLDPTPSIDPPADIDRTV